MSIVEQAGKAMLSMDITGKYHINRPDLWPFDTEINFGGKMRGYRKMGTITAAVNTDDVVPILPSANAIDLQRSGGTYTIGNAPNNLREPITSTSTGAALTSFRHSMVRINITGGLEVVTRSNIARTNAPYKVWVLYEIA